MPRGPQLIRARKLTSSKTRDYSGTSISKGPKVLILSQMQEQRWQLEDRRKNEQLRTQSKKSRSLQRRRDSASVLTDLTGHKRSAPSVYSLSPTTTTTTPDEPRPCSRFSTSSQCRRRGDTQPSTPASASATTSVPVTPVVLK